MADSGRVLVILLLLVMGPFAYADKSGSGSGSKKYGFRIQYGFLDAKMDEFDKQIESKINSSVPAAKDPNFIAIDMLYMPNDMLYGLRYEIFRAKASSSNSSSSVESDLSGHRLNGLVGWRFLRLQKGYLGLVSHLNLGINALDYELNTTAGNVKQKYEYKGETEYGYGIALDGAYYADGLYPTGLEIGYTKYAANSFKDSSGATARDSSGADFKADLSGLYFRFHVGVVF